LDEKNRYYLIFLIAVGAVSEEASETTGAGNPVATKVIRTNNCANAKAALPTHPLSERIWLTYFSSCIADKTITHSHKNLPGPLCNR
jgi:hypothetical protein